MIRMASAGSIHRRPDGVFELFVDGNQFSFRVWRE